MGDNLAGVGYGASTGRLRRPRTQRVLDARLGSLHERTWNLSWLAARRRLNEEADRAATEGVQWAANMRDQGLCEPATRVKWYIPLVNSRPTPPEDGGFGTTA